MSRELKRVILMILVLVALVGSYFLVKNWNEQKQEKEKAEAQESNVIVRETDPEDIIELSYMVNGEEIAFTKKDDTWVSEKDNAIDIDENAITTLLQSLSSVQAQSTISKNNVDLEGFGLEKPTNIIKVTTASGTDTYSFGIKNSITGQYYLRMNEDADVYCVSTTIPEDFTKSAESLTISADSATSDIVTP